jgi:sialate O-acetylesterase
MNHSRRLFAVLAMSVASPAMAAVHVNPLFTDHAVLQRDRPVPVWGTADAGETVTVKFGTAAVTAKADDKGHWSAVLPAMPASDKPGTLVVTDHGADTTFTDVLVGDVWLCSGQSNMERQLGLRPPQLPLNDWEKEVAAADHPTIRLLTVAEGGTPTPRAEAKVGAGWAACTPETAVKFSAVGYFFGRDLQGDVKVPIGLIHSSVGGTPAEAWTSRPVFEASPELAPLVTAWEKEVAAYPAIRAKWDAAHTATTTATSRPTARAVRPANPSVRGTTTLFNGMIAPLMPYGIRGAIWYQGESDAAPPVMAERYRRLFPAMVADWRARWGEGDFPFAGTPPLIRESQRLSLAKIPNSAMVVLTDAGEANNIHPRNKQVVGERLALAARAIAYGEPVEYSGPMFKSLTVKGADAVVSFDHVGKGFEAKGGPLRGFEVAGADGKFVPATATVAGETVVVHADAVRVPVAVRYAWAAVPDVNLFNADGLPASPFTSEVSK